MIKDETYYFSIPEIIILAHVTLVGDSYKQNRDKTLGMDRTIISLLQNVEAQGRSNSSL
jgi:hypothetical protein